MKTVYSGEKENYGQFEAASQTELSSFGKIFSEKLDSQTILKNLRPAEGVALPQLGLVSGVVHGSDGTPYPFGSKPIAATKSLTSRPYWRVEMCGRPWNRLGNVNGQASISGDFTHARAESLVFSVS